MHLGNNIAAIVTGGGSGLGAATARGLGAKGVRVAVLDVNEAEGSRVAGEIGGRFVKCDVASEPCVEAALAEARAAHGQERILVNCAGVAVGKRTVRRVRETSTIEPHDMASFSKCIAVNLVGTFLMISRSAAGMMAVLPLNGDG